MKVINYKKELKPLINLLPISSIEIGLVLEAFNQYALLYNKEHDNLDMYNLGIISCNYQYNMRVFKERILNNGTADFANIEENNKFFYNMIKTFPKLIDFITHYINKSYSKYNDIEYFSLKLNIVKEYNISLERINDYLYCEKTEDDLLVVKREYNKAFKKQISEKMV